MNGSSSNRATFAPKDSSAALRIIADGKEHLRREQKWRERFEAYSFPDAGELKRRIREEGLMLRAEDCACLRYAVGCLEHREKAAEWFRGLAEVLQGMADTHGAEAKAVALRFRRILDDSDPAARLEEALVKCADFAERCFIGGARPEPVAGETRGEARADGTHGKRKRGQRKAVSIADAAEMCGVSERAVKNWEAGENTPEGWPGRDSIDLVRAFSSTYKARGALGRHLQKVRYREDYEAHNR